MAQRRRVPLADGTRLLSRRSRFGTPVRDTAALLSALERNADTAEFVGAAHHIDSTGVEETARALEQCVLPIDEFRARGLTPRPLDIGGGFGVCNVAESEEWERWTSALTEAVLGVRSPLTWRG